MLLWHVGIISSSFPDSLSISISTLCNRNGTVWGPIRSVTIRVITKSDEREAGIRFVYV